MNVKIEITLTDDDYTEEAREIQVQIQESIPDGFQNLDRWEADVRRMGFQAMREIYRRGIELYEKKLLSEYTHISKQCQTVKRGKLDLMASPLIVKVPWSLLLVT